MKRKLFTLASALSLLLFGCLLPGCLFDPEAHYGYVLLKGDPSQITQWTLAQKDYRRISDGIAALTVLASDAPVLPYEKGMAVEGLQYIYAKLLKGWPGYTGLPSYVADYQSTPPGKRREVGIEDLTDQLFWGLAVAHKSPRTRALFFKLRPDPGRYPKVYQLWHNEGVEGGLLPPQMPTTKEGGASHSMEALVHHG